VEEEIKKKPVEEVKGEFTIEGPINEEPIGENELQLAAWQGLDKLEPEADDLEDESDEEGEKKKEGFTSRMMNKIFFKNSVGRNLFPQLKVSLECKE
jgi:hypothetical protein